MVYQISKLFKNDKMGDSPTVTNNNNNKMSQKCVEVKAFYNKHFPTDKRTYNLRVPFVGLVLSILSLHFVATCFAIKYYVNRPENSLVKYCFIFVATCVGYELYYGLKIGDRKQFTPWILLKFIELCFIFATIIYIFCDNAYYLRYHVADIIYGIILLALNGIVTYIVTSTSVKQFRGYASKTNTAEENNYDTYDNV